MHIYNFYRTSSDQKEKFGLLTFCFSVTKLHFDSSSLDILKVDLFVARTFFVEGRSRNPQLLFYLKSEYFLKMCLLESCCCCLSLTIGMHFICISYMVSVFTPILLWFSCPISQNKVLRLYYRDFSPFMPFLEMVSMSCT